MQNNGANWNGSIRKIQEIVCREFCTNLNEMKSGRRNKEIVVPRHVAFWLCKKLTMASLPAIGRAFGNRDHTTIIWGIRRIEKKMLLMPDLKDRAEKLLRSCSNVQISE